MKKLLLISIFVCSISVQTKAQGLKLTGQTYSNVSDSVTFTALYSYPVYNYNTADSTLSITFPVYRSIYAAKNKQVLTSVNLGNYISKSSIGIPTAAYLLGIATTFLNGLGFTVTTF